ncbi:MAG: hypothetical protein ACLFS9_02370, partial [Nitriliruptoraceae bacterium]
MRPTAPPPPPPAPPRVPLPPPPPSTASSAPVPPPRRGSLAGWVAGLGALLLLAAAATFLAVRWDILTATARIAIVGSVTAAAVLGGHRLRRSLPTVGLVVFHLGAVLLPVDAFGLVLQLDGPLWARWVAPGVTALVLFPVLALAGRAPLLALISLAGVPVLATGLALALGWAPTVLVALGGAALLPLAGRDVPAPLAPIAAAGSLLLPATAVLVGLAVELLAALPAAGLVAGAAGTSWLVGWEVRAVAAVVVSATLAVRARTGRPPVVAVALSIVVLALAHLVLPPATPRAVRLWTPALAWLAIEAVALGTGSRALAGRGARAAALAVEVAALPVALLATSVVL